MPFTYQTLAEVLVEYGRRLYDPNSVFWTDDEKTLYIQEAIRTFNACANYYRGDFILNLTQGTVWYNMCLTSEVPNTLRPLTVTDTDLMTILEYHLLEPPTGKTWTGSLQFSAESLLFAIQRRRDELVSGTSASVQRSLVAALPSRTYLPDDIIDLRRVAWLPTSGYSNSPLYPDDTFGLQAYERDYTTATPGMPLVYTQSTEPPLSFDVDVPPAVPGQYELLAVQAGPELSLVSSPADTLLVPDDFAWVLKWGALADLLNHDSNARDPLRAAYCNARYKMGMALMLNAPSVLAARMTNLPLDIDSVQNADEYRPGWQAESQDTPDLLMVAGLNLIGFAATPDAGPNAATITVVRNAPVPTGVDSHVEVGRDEMDAILDYAVHLALFKSGGAEFIATYPLLERFMKQCAIYNSKLQALGEYMVPIYAQGQAQSRTNPVLNDPSAVGAGGGSNGA